MAATRDLLKEVDELSLNLIVSLQLEDARALQYGQDRSAAVASRLHAEEFLQYQAVCHFENEETKLAEVSATAASGENEPADCVSCEDRFRVGQVFQAPCSHYYCSRCLEQLHESAMTNETLYPPRCCRNNMPWEAVRSKLSSQLASSFEAKKEELDTNAGDRTYCYDPDCQKFIGADDIVNDIAICPACNLDTCKMCKAAAHGGDCPRDEALQQTLELAEQQGWSRCGACGRIVDLMFGCFHITCICRHEYCYRCGAAWKTCRCPQWDERRLLARANDIVNRNPAAARAPAQQREDLVAREVENLRENHECDHERWERQNAEFNQCEECGYEAPIYLMVCRQCGLRACYRCMRNRL